MEKLFIDGKVIVLDNFPAFKRTLSSLDESYHARIFNEDQIVVEKIKNPHYKTGQYYFSIKTCNGLKPKKHLN